jgi:adenylosuccinate lyase
MSNVVGGLEVHPARIQQRIRAELPFMATENILVEAVAAGGDRQRAHEVIRRHSIAAARAMKDGAPTNDLLDRLANDPSLGIPRERLAVAADPSRYVGRAPQQVDEFLSDVIAPMLAGSLTTPLLEEIRV